MATNQQNFRVRNGLTIDGSTSGSSSFANPATGSDLSYVLPGTAGASSTVLTNDGSGNLSWALPGGGGSTFGNVTIGVDTDNTISTTTGDLIIDSATDLVQIGAQLYVNSTQASAGTFTVNSAVTANEVGVLNLTAISTGTPAVGFGPALLATSELADGSEMGVGYISWAATDMTSGSEDFEIQLAATKNGASPDEKVYIDSDGNVKADGNLTINYDQTAANAVINAYSSTALGTQTWDGANWTLSSGVVSDNARFGNVTVGTLTDQTISTTSGNLILDAGSSAYVSIENSYPSEPTFITRTSANTTSSARNLTLRSETTATPGVGFGGALEWQVEAQPGNVERAAYINVSATDVTAGSEDFRMDFGLMRNGAAYDTKMSIFSNGDIDMELGGKLAIKGATSGYTQIGAPATGANIVYTLPGADGTSGYVLSTNGAGTLSWVANPDVDTTYTISSSSTTGGANLTLTGSDASTDSVAYLGSGATTVVSTDANTVTISSTDTNTTYTQDASATTGGANLNLVGSDATTDTVKFASGTNVTVAQTDASTITISATDTNTTYTQNASATTGGANLNLVGSDATTDTITFQSGTNVTVSQVDANTINISTTGITPTDVQQVFAEVRNQQGSTITIGQVVYLFGATGNHPTVKLADNSGDSTSAKSLGLVYDASINDGAQGLVITQGLITGVNTAAFAEGDSLYLGSTPGSVTNVKPYAPEHLVYIGVVVKSNVSTGEIFVRVQNGYELGEIHDVDLITNPPTNNQVLTYVAATDLWTAQNTQNIFNQTLNTTDNVEFASVKSSTILTNEVRPFDSTDVDVKLITTGSGTYQTGKAYVYVQEDVSNPNGIAGVVVNSNQWTFLSDGKTGFPNYTFPAADGTSGQYLETDGTGSLTWATPSSPGTTYTIDASSTTGGANLNLVGSDATTDTVKFQSGTNVTVAQVDANTISISATAANPFDQSLNTTDSVEFNSLQVSGGSFITDVGVSVTMNTDNIQIGDGVATNTQGFTINAGTGGSAYTYYDPASTGSYNIGVNGVTDLWKFNNNLTTSFPNFTFPAADGTSGQVLSTNGSGVVSWVAPSTGGTTYTIDASSTSGGANLNLVGSDASTDTIKFASGTNVTVAQTDANTITISATGGGGSSLPMPPSSSMTTNPWSLCPGNLYVGGINNGITVQPQNIVYTPFYVAAPITLSEVSIWVATATSLVGCSAMVYISQVNISGATGWQPTALLSGGYLGEITGITTTGIKSITGLSTVLPAGAYLMAVQTSNFTGTLQIRGPSSQCIIGSGYAFASDFSPYNWRRQGVAYTSGTPAAVANWTQYTAGAAQGITNWVQCKWTVN